MSSQPLKNVWASIFWLLIVKISIGQVQIGQDLFGDSSYDYFGLAVASSYDGSILAIGAPLNESRGLIGGQVKVYQFQDNEWKQLGANMDGAEGTKFGRSLALSSDGVRLAVGAHLSESGSVFIYEFQDTSWVQLGLPIEGETPEDEASFEDAVSLSGDGTRVAIGAAFNDGNGEKAGHTRVFEWSGNQWNQLGDDIDGEAAGDAFGLYVSLSEDGNRLAVGAPNNDGNGPEEGHVRVFQWDGTNWTKIGQDIDGKTSEPPGLNRGSKSGVVALSKDGNRVAIGSPNYTFNFSVRGIVQVYEYDGEKWIKQGKDIQGNWFLGDPISLSANGMRVAVAEPDERVEDDFFAGRVRIYDWNPQKSDWVQYGRALEGEFENHHFGDGIFLSPDGLKLFVGATGDNSKGDFTGRVRAFRLGFITDLESEVDGFKNGVYTFPNPTNQTVYFSTAQQPLAIRIYNNNGQLLRQSNSVQNKIDISDLKEGVYFLQFIFQEGLITRKVVKQTH